MYSYNKPASLEEAFDIVRGQVPQKMKSVLNDPFGSFVANLAKAVKESKQTYVPKKEPKYVQPEAFEEELIEEEELTQEEEEIYLVEALTELEVALQRARDEVCERQQLLAEQEAEQKAREELTKQQLVAEEKARLSHSLSNLEEAFQKARNEISKRQQTTKAEVPVTIEEKVTPILTETIKEDSETITEKSYVPVAKNQETNPYLKELVRSSQFDEKKVKGSRKKSELKKLIAEQIAAELNAFKQQLYTSNIMMGNGGGGGTNAVQYAAGGTMRGDLNVTGKILSGGIDLSEAIKQSVTTAVLGLTSLNITATLPDPFVVDDGSF